MRSQESPAFRHYTVETEWQGTARVRIGVRRVVDAHDNPNAPQFDAAALAAALRLEPKPLPSGVARKVTATYAIPYDILVARIRRRIRAPAAE